MFQRRFWAETLERATKSFAQGILTMWLASDVVNAFAADWYDIFGVAGGYALVSVATSIISAPVGPQDSASVL